ncbi:MAG: ferrochelatase [Chloroflexi bacterium]|nr:ferrochelatase [Chloroflexota bacterium]
MASPGTSGLLLLSLGTPRSPATGDVRDYLREFLSDPYVLDMPGPVRWLLLNLVILPFRPSRSAQRLPADLVGTQFAPACPQGRTAKEGGGAPGVGVAVYVK